ncbi:unnamed protein product [Medioppia subpectinata]|uniref:VWFA domain-containing protein n=1 Tax=Medioppia subpectinata TaxID=1979941 RepID=A0A7R9L278_9ACAR|nr:unnamed protein product [Medioppia subpectinata]CAG2112985.1 unnamed protein product [Medioppia subpectinata]
MPKTLIIVILDESGSMGTKKSVELDNVPELTAHNYLPGGMTALYDAIAEGVRLADRDKTNDERVICVIMTDGEENSSRETTKEQVRHIISGYEAKGDWTFVYIGENPERWSRDAGMSATNAINYDHINTRNNYTNATSAVSQFRKSLSKQSTNLFSKD